LTTSRKFDLLSEARILEITDQPTLHTFLHRKIFEHFRKRDRLRALEYSYRSIITKFTDINFVIARLHLCTG